MALLPDDLCIRLFANGAAAQWLENCARADFYPVAKLYTPDGSCSWLLTHIFRSEPDCAYGLIDTGDGTPRIGQVSIRELEEAAGPLGLAIRCDENFSSTQTVSELAALAKQAGKITEGGAR